jgi:type VI secretion system Hcp family effector
MTVSSFAQVEGVPGPAKGAGVDGMIELYAFDYELSMPTDPRDNTITGRRRHGFYTITHEIGKHSPLFFKHLSDNISIPSMTVHHYQPDPASGDIKKYYRHELKEVKVVCIEQNKPNTCDPKSENFRDMEEIRVKFEEITFADEEGNEYTDKWEME